MYIVFYFEKSYGAETVIGEWRDGVKVPELFDRKAADEMARAFYHGRAVPLTQILRWWK